MFYEVQLEAVHLYIPYFDVSPKEFPQADADFEGVQAEKSVAVFGDNGKAVQGDCTQSFHGQLVIGYVQLVPLLQPVDASVCYVLKQASATKVQRCHCEEEH